VHQLEGYILTPLIQRRAVLLPPAVALFSLFGMGTLFGTLGVLLATPLAVCIHVIVRRSFAPDAPAS
jgi:predicted PurR-regulated permease PerM